MLQAFINRASDALHDTISRYISRLIVSVPIVVAVAFATAAAAHELSSLYGPTRAYLALAVVFAVLALIAAAVMAAKERSAAGASAAPVHAVDQPAMRSDAGSPEFKFDPAMLLIAGRLAGPAAASVRTLLRNWPLVLGAAILAWLLLSDTNESKDATTAEPAE